MLSPRPLPPVPAETARIARAAFPKGHPYLAAAGALGDVFTERGPGPPQDRSGEFDEQLGVGLRGSADLFREDRLSLLEDPQEIRWAHLELSLPDPDDARLGNAMRPVPAMPGA